MVIGANFGGKTMPKHVSKGEVTSKRAASAAAKVLRNPKSSKAAKTASASALTQRPNKK
ncbi:hypothetical protein [Sinorhizobium sp. CCBAU 05631]|uniref:hypothetical protein n=1 Tax=Sinorhizobium sp. CCBAU 05631 TaxID=794846 RepID=UPI0004B668BD|nr:hypothetical protein [Sinorhizobium sp. CCBAU 05631]ASY61362.1 hypothetical protein SS05631_d64610 [Sinorhizobium sp. CCBAU 05631]